MFDFFKNLLSGKQSEPGNAFQAPPAAPAPAPKNSPAPAVRQHYPQPAAAAPRMPAPVSQPVADGNSVEIPVGSILVALPPELKTRVRPADIGAATFPVSLEQIFSQLGSGSVKISFGELRQAMPQLFTNAADCDDLPVALPLNEILGRVNPALLVRRPNQKQIEIPEEISSPFASPENGLNFSRATSVDPAPAPAPRATTPAAPAPNRTDIFQRKPAAPATPARPFVAPAAPATPAASVPPTPVKPAVRPAARPAAPVQPPVAPYAFQAPAAPATPPVNPVPRVPVVPAKPASVVPPPAAPVAETPVVEEPTSIPVSAALRSLESSIGMPAPKNNSAPKATPASQPVPPTKPAAEVPSLSVPLISLTGAWPESLRQEISQLNLAEARVALPIAPVEEAMRRGKVHFPWTTIRSWITPAPAPAASAHDALVLELPLKVLMPLFMARFRGGKSQQKVLIDEKIPNLFFGFPQPDAPAAPAPAPAAATPAAHSLAHPVAKPTETNYYVWEENADSAKLDETEFKRKPVVETNFLSRHATPNEVVARAAALPGVIGALVALPDGLMVASKVPSDLNADTLAAFLPQIFGKVSQCTKELRMGDLNNLNFTVGNVPWKIFRVNAIFFAAFGCPGKGLPTAELAALAGQLDRKKQ